MLKKIGLALAGISGLAAAPVLAHHSFAVFFDSNKIVTVKGKVTSFRFANPHGTVALDVTGPDGKVVHWRAETNAPVLMARRGWTRNTLKPGDTVTIEGWMSRDGKPYLRLRQVFDANGKPVGASPFSAKED